MNLEHPAGQATPFSTLLSNNGRAVLQTLEGAAASTTSIEARLAEADRSEAGVVDVAQIASKVAGVTSLLSTANLTHGMTLLGAAALASPLADLVGSWVPGWATAAHQVGLALTGILGLAGALARKPAVADTSTSRVVAPAAKGG